MGKNDVTQGQVSRTGAPPDQKSIKNAEELTYLSANIGWRSRGGCLKSKYYSSTKELPKGRTTALTLLHNQGWRKINCDSDTSGLYYKHSMIVNYASSIINKLKALHNDNARVVIYYRHVQATGPF